ncbi:GT2 family glycosyltransferase [Litoreibacter meonggei]|uniref:GT2 family glycosyltransferase n=1 Tax=Litoreibacter meonggei TaxID=1049199 RepID=A0A497WQ80_9RHOB|nr:glycosyltransferase [Litoreibacter meonggei]RLJ52119.1 GT2 family glycosyltransferase [Litoreibacter meonggei]
MTSLSVSVVIVSRHRPDELRRCIKALEFQTFRDVEIVVVVDGDTATNLHELVPLDRVKAATCDEANISRARNIGIGLAAGDLVAFIDDDAIAEPTWLERLIEPFSDPNVGASGGFVRGRNGISFQWRAEVISVDGVSSPIDIGEVTVLKADPNKGIKTQGTNCAFRRAALYKLNGFDENYRFYLDESDLNLRVGQAGWLTAVVPNAEVQHGFAASYLRGKDRRPKSLFEVGASQAYFIKKFGGMKAALLAFRKQQWVRLESVLVKGTLEPRDLRRLRTELDAGIADGQGRDPLVGRVRPAQTPLKPFSIHKPESHKFIAGRWLFRRRVYAEAKRLAENGVPCTAIILSPTAVFHRRWFHEDGFWVQSGGIFGKSTRSDSLWSWYSFAKRIRREQASLQKTR